ncbi:hypothetical protein FGE12_24495 [Aggregicoccus sp. 17bor-14]|uniref:hypothetical protein n=1 Tax=Myxococcaceae TaxID=31 RepID=UPI00129CEF10|nr:MULTISPECIES: hypothetical protein [Myxococcaceae]MBF5045590.1 hypothetical protein [Simulacricoccus sp. 17bor-14]MRI91327.1 hypothetical protein [Aggregicoccus sp. 17bor-14]
MQHGDSLVPALVSLYDWEPFYWEQDRFGMLVPLLVWPIRHPLGNVIAQFAVASFFTLLGPLLVSRFLLRGRSWLWAGLAADVLLLCGLPHRWAFEWLLGQPYGVSMGLGFLGLVLLDPEGRDRPSARDALGFGAMCLASWVSPSTTLVLGLVIVAREVLAGHTPRHALRNLLWLLLPTIAQAVLMGQLARLARYAGVTKTGLAPTSDWVPAWRTLGDNFHQIWWDWALAVSVALVLVGLLAWARRRVRHASLGGLGLLAAAICYFVLLGALTWLKMNLYGVRYLIPVVALWAAGACVLAVGRVEWTLSPRRAGALLVALAGMLYLRFGPPSYAEVYRTLDTSLGGYSDELTRNHATHMLGDYFLVWPTVFHINWKRYESGDPTPFWGLTHRSQSNRNRWRGLPQHSLRIAVLKTDPQVPAYLQMLGYTTAVQVGESERFRYLQPPEP